ncbi:MAG: DsbA family protein [Proteobacteria bacterium]|nr:DsbA family protein [Pseudomonadota bacterium]
MAAAVEVLDKGLKDIPPAAVDIYYDFRSPYAYFACHRIRQRLFVPPRSVTWRWQPVSIDILLNLQAGRDPWAAYVDPLPAPKRAHLIADVRRSAAFYGASLRPPRPSRPNSISALSIAALLGVEDHEIFRNATFNALWQEQRDIGNPDVLAECLAHTAKGVEVFAQAQSPNALRNLAERTSRAYADGIFGVPSFVWNGEVFFGNDRLEMLGWRLGAPDSGQ